MDRASELDCVRRFLRHLRDETTDLAPEPLRLSVSHFIDRAHLDRERRHVFRRQPKLAALSGDLPEPGSHLALEIGGVPILLLRHTDGRARAFVNACRHRGSPLVQEGRGCTTGGHLECPFHAWTYATDGRLVRTPRAEGAFGELDPARAGLRPRPCLETDGLIFVRAEGDEPIDADVVLEGVGPDLRSLGLAAYHPFETHTRTWRCNWKLILDTFLESYHVFSLHRETVSPWFFSVPMIHDGWGPNLRFPVARRTLAQLEDVPERDWRLADHATVQWLVGSNALLSQARDHLLLWQLTPLTPGSCAVRTTLYAPTRADTPEAAARLDKAFALQLRVTGDEDFPIQERIQANLESGAVPELLYGRHEVAAIHLQRALAAAIEAGETETREGVA